MKHIAAGKNQHHYGFRGLAGRLAKIPVFDRMVFNVLRPKINADKCVGCGICAKVCPVSNIEMAEKCAVNGNRCEYCLACVHFCPHQAMELRHKPTLKERQYHHPSIKVKDIIR